jgi:sucrose-phosphate synthase
MNDERGLYIFMLSVHGLVRGERLELGRDADTGGQVTYVVELARALARSPAVGRVDLLTRLIEDPSVDEEYRVPEEAIGPGARIVRLAFGPRRYLRKELLWSHLDQLVDRCLLYLKRQRRLPDVIHSHYADAGYVGHHLSLLLGIPLVHTGHSLGRIKRARLLASGRKEGSIDRQFNFAQRIEAEEAALEHASLVVASTRQEVHSQYGLYQSHRPGRMAVIPPGTDTTRFAPPAFRIPDPRIAAMIERFVFEPDKPPVLAICRPEERKNLARLVRAFGESPELRTRANLVVFAGCRDDVRAIEDEAQQRVLAGLLLDIDRYDLWGYAAVPKRHEPEDVPEIYRYAVQRGGIFANTALTEPFGLTLLEAAATGLPVVATHDGGPRDIIANCRNGLLVDPLDTAAIAGALCTALSDRAQWRRWARNGVAGIRRHYTWDAHVSKYLRALQRVVYRERKHVRRTQASTLRGEFAPMPFVTHMLVCDIDDTLLGDRTGLQRLLEWLRANVHHVAFAVATGRSVDSAARVLREHHVPAADVWITAVGSEIHYGRELRPDPGWARHIRHLWRRDALAAALQGVPGLRLQGREHQREFKLSYYVDPGRMPSIEEVRGLLRARDLHANLIFSRDELLDILPVRASKGAAVRHLAYRWGLPLRSFLVAGDSGNDAGMLVGDTLGVVVGNHSAELDALRDVEQVYFADRPAALGILEGIRRYRFADEVRGAA